MSDYEYDINSVSWFTPYDKDKAKYQTSANDKLSIDVSSNQREGGRYNTFIVIVLKKSLNLSNFLAIYYLKDFVEFQTTSRT